ncbi:unnamed protein product [Zymoseptoria tritici ST99CH_3D1]|nr:unnamed protein product [Zymoseptoria tritici ST99CH_3D1]
MPVPSTLSARSARHRSAMSERRRPASEGPAAEERRHTTMLNGTDLWDRPNWPLASPEPDGEELDAALKEELEEESTARRKSQDTNGILGDGYTYYEHNVSDVEEEADTETGASSSSHTLPQDKPPSRTSAKFHRVASLESLESPLPSVSPLGARHQGSPSLFNPGSTATVSADLSRSTNDTISTHETTNTSPRPRQQSIQFQINGQEQRAEDDEEHTERRSTLTTTPINISRNSHPSPVLQQASRLSYFPAPGSTNVDGSNCSSSTSQAPMQYSSLHRRTSTRSSWGTTTISPQKECLRYSWQSLKDVEPNRPRIHIIKLVSNSVTASAGFPTGEAFGFSISPRGRRVAAYNSARLFVLQAAALPVGITQEYTLKRRPLAVEVTDLGSTMAVLADDHTINVYDIGLKVRRSRTIKLDYPTTCIALAPTGGLLAAAYEGGIEIFSLDPKAMPTDRRAVRSVKVDRLAFSEDGSTLLGTTTRVNASSTVVVSVPVFPASHSNIPTHEELKEAWCSNLLHPENIRNSSHAVFMRENRQTNNEKLFAWNGLEDTFGLLNMSDLTYGNIEFPIVIFPPLSTNGGLGAAVHSCPTIDEFGDTIAVIVNDRTIRLYIVPPKQQDEETPVEAHSIDHQLDEGYGCPFSEVRWMHSSPSLPAPADNLVPVQGRLIVTSPGGVSENGDEGVEDVEGGRIILFDFDPQFSGQPGQTFSLILGKCPPQMLEEEQVDVAEQVALVRKRSVAQHNRGALSQRPALIGRAASTIVSRSQRGVSPAFTNSSMGHHGRSRASMISIGTMQSDGARSLPDLMESNEQADVYEEPYMPGQPRSHASLQRAATNAQRHRFQTLEERNREGISVEQSTGNFLSLPEYSEEPNAPLPQKFRALAGLDGPQMFDPNKAKRIDEDITEFPPRSSSRANGAPDGSPVAGGSGERSNSPLPGVSPTGGLPSPYPAARSFTPTLRGGEPHRPDSPAGSTRTFDSQSQNGTMAPYGTIASLPRGLQRAYGNAVSPMSGVPAPRSDNGDEPWDIISPVSRLDNCSASPISPYVHSSPQRQPSQLSYNPRFSALAPGIQTSPSRAPSSAGSYNPSTYSNDSHYSPTSRRLPPHMQAFRNAAAAAAMQNPTASGSASLFPMNQSRDHVPLRAVQSSGKAGSVAHPVTGWHPPAAASTPTLRDSGKVMEPLNGLARTASERSTKSAAYVITGGRHKGRKGGFFHRGKGRQELLEADAGSYMEKKSVFTHRSRRDERDGKCAVM